MTAALAEVRAMNWSSGPRDESAAPSARRTPAKLKRVRDDGDLIERAKSGDTVAFRDLFRSHREDVSRLVHRMVGSNPDHEDLVQEVFLQVHRSLKDFGGRARFSTWLYRVTVNVVLMYRRAGRSRPVLIGEPEGTVAEDHRPLPDEEVARNARVRAFYRLLDRLTEKKRTVFVLHELEGVSPAEIAKIVDAPVLTVRTRLFYARRELEEMLREEPTLAKLADELTSDKERSATRRTPTARRRRESA